MSPSSLTSLSVLESIQCVQTVCAGFVPVAGVDCDVPAKPHWRRDRGRGVEVVSRGVEGEERKMRVSTKCFAEVVRTCVLLVWLAMLRKFPFLFLDVGNSRS